VSLVHAVAKLTTDATAAATVGATTSSLSNIDNLLSALAYA